MPLTVPMSRKSRTHSLVELHRLCHEYETLDDLIRSKPLNDPGRAQLLAEQSRIESALSELMELVWPSVSSDAD